MRRTEGKVRAETSWFGPAGSGSAKEREIRGWI